MTINLKVTLQNRPERLPSAEDFRLETCALEKLQKGDFLTKILYCSLDPATRKWMDEDSYGSPIPLGGAISCLAVGQVIQSRCSEYKVGDYVVGLGAVSRYAIMRPGPFTRKIKYRGDISLTHYLNAIGATGSTAYNGLLKVGKPSPGETVLVSGAAGAVGSIVGQIAKIQGCKVIGIAGGSEKCRLLTEFYGFDKAVDYKGKTIDQLQSELGTACPDGVDVFFDNVGGDILDATLTAINLNARLIECGMISLYNTGNPPAGPQNIWQVVAKSATIYGFLNRYYSDYFDEAYYNLEKWLADGSIKTREDIVDGIENFYPAFMKLFDGTNKGKLILRINH